jgi:pyruvate formate lyase activating enzyme
MIIAGFQKLTLIDYPGHLATTVFTVGCSFRCPFCHNPELVVETQNFASVQTNNAEKEFLKFLKTRHGKLDGVCITGGEPTIQPDILDFIKKVKKLGYAVKLDTNGTRPDVLRKVITEKLVDFIAMDIKNQPKRYNIATGTKFDIERIKLSVNLIMNSRIPYELRTTVVPGIHSEKDFLYIAKWIGGAKSYYLQKYVENKILDPKLKVKTRGKKMDLEKIKKTIAPYFGNVGIRG